MLQDTAINLIYSPFFQRALLVGLVLGLLMAIMGVLVVLRRLSFFADAIGHSALAGIAIGLLFTASTFWPALAFSLIIAATIAAVRRFSRLHLDTLLGVFFPSAMALGIIIIQFLPGYQSDLLSLLFGDILAVQSSDIWLSIALALVIGILLASLGKKFIAIAVDESLAQAEGISVWVYETIFLLMLAAVIALAIKLVGVILVTALLVIPAATSQNIARSFTSLLLLSCIVSIFAVVSGLIASTALNIPSGPGIVLASATAFAVSLILKKFNVAL